MESEHIKINKSRSTKLTMKKMSTCPVFITSSILGKKWTFAILQQINLHAHQGFNEMHRRMFKISSKVLSKRLQEMVNEGIIKKEFVVNNNIKKTNYRLTEKGKDLYGISEALKSWGAKYLGGRIECPRIECVKCPLY